MYDNKKRSKPAISREHFLMRLIYLSAMPVLPLNPGQFITEISVAVYVLTLSLFFHLHLPKGNC